ncbi:MAG: hypothetical protein IJ745_08070, partial [Bacteroidales bacterium]|nr:hypothetical protein [Bacteroidales bacterium]
VQVVFQPVSREFNERWYSDLRASRIQPFVPGQMPGAPSGYSWSGAAPAAAPKQPMTPQQPMQSMQQPAAQPANFAAAPQMSPSADDDLPF